MEYELESFAMMSCIVEHLNDELFWFELGFLNVIHVFTSVPGVN